MQEELKRLEKEAVEKVEAAGSLKEVNDVRVAYLEKRDRSRKCFGNGKAVR